MIDKAHCIWMVSLINKISDLGNWESTNDARKIITYATSNHLMRHMHNRVIGPYSFENEGVTETVNGETYQNMLLHQLSSKWIIVMNSVVYLPVTATHLIYIFSCCMRCLARTSYPKDGHWSGHQNYLTYCLQISYCGAI